MKEENTATISLADFIVLYQNRVEEQSKSLGFKDKCNSER